ncbi:MAG: type II toxin-antitoxin system HicB family antitoxin [Cryomorphaceae bacterium]|nr:type II toxin-antitoxin system HicB family antitoxin [Flavobacteriales bacterium]
MKYLTHKGYTGSIEYSREDDLLYGRVLGIKGLISYDGATGKELYADFKGAIDEYITTCEEQGVTAEKPFKGSFNVRLSSKLHEQAALLAMETKTSLNAFVAESIRIRIMKEMKEA